MLEPQIDLASTWNHFCVGCNAWFPQPTSGKRCPNCDRDLILSDPSNSETMVMGPSESHPPTPPKFKPGAEDPIVGRRVHVYDVMSLLGAGAMGRVYLANHGDLQRHCAVKILAPKRGRCDDDYIERFMQEGRAAAALVHPNIVTVHAVGQVEGLHFLEMEFISGRSLQQLIHDEGPLPTDRALRLAMMIADGLAAAHRDGIVHRDVKPDNVLLNKHGIAKIGDFGLAKRVLNRRGDPFADGICGTPNYMAPELFQGQPATPASDVYALGICLYQMLIGRLPHGGGASLQSLVRTTAELPIPNIRDFCPDLSLEVASCVAAMTASTPANRPADAIVASQLLHAVLGHERDLESLLLEAFRHEPSVTWTRDGERYRVMRRLPHDRQQVVFIEPSEHEVDERLLLLYSVCCRAEPHFYEQALRRNSEMAHGSLALREVDGQTQFVVTDTYPRSTVDPEEIRRTVFEIALQADCVEHQLTGQDRN